MGKKKGGEAAAAEPKPAKPAKAPKAAAPKPARGVVVEKPKANIYTAMLVVAFVAILIGCLCLYAEMNAYNFELKAR